jgi:hypothetical protein
MASLPISAAHLVPLPSPRAKPSAMVGAAVPQARLSALEWSVVAMAERDGLSSIREPGRFVSALSSIFGISRANRLANERLEALRRIAIFAWTSGWNVPKRELASFLDAGFTTDQFELIQRSIGEARLGRRRKTVR